MAKRGAAEERLRRECCAHFARIYDRPPILVWGITIPSEEAREIRKGPRPVAWVSEAPSARDVLASSPVAGRSGKAVSALIAEARLGCPSYATLAVKQPSARSDGSPRPPTREDVALFAPWLLRELALVHPIAVVALGNTALRALCGGRSMAESRHEMELELGRARVPLYAMRHPAGLPLHGADAEAELRHRSDVFAALRALPDEP